jgi:hypothetical protein
MVGPIIFCGATTGYKKQLFAVLVGPVRFKAKNTLNRVRPNKIKNIFLFLIVFYLKN